MARPRLQFHSILTEIVDNVYFQPPTNTKLEYPCIVYERDSASLVHADNTLYRYTKRYLVTVIDRDPDSTLPDQVAELPLTDFNRFFTSDGLNHDVFNVYF